MNKQKALETLGYTLAGYLIEDDLLNKVTEILQNKTFKDAREERKVIAIAYKYAACEKYVGDKLGSRGFDESDNFYYSSHFFKIAPQAKKEIDDDIIL